MPTLSIDFDDTLRARDGAPLPGAREALLGLRARGCRILITSSRLDPVLWADQLPFRIREIRAWLAEHDIPFDDVLAHKPAADLYIDDKAYRFEGDWSAAAPAIDRLLGLKA